MKRVGFFSNVHVSRLRRIHLVEFHIYSAKKESVHTLKPNKIHVFAWISMQLLTQPWVSIVHWHAASQVGWYDITPPPCNNMKTT